AQLAYRHGPYTSSSDTPRQFGRPADSLVADIAMLKLGTTNIELLQINSPTASATPPRPDDAGGHHIALYIDDMDSAIESAIAEGIDVLGEPMPLPGPESGPGARFVYLRSPWGLMIEIVSYPNGKQCITADPKLV